jgi:predicted RNase H-like HicB family nuclease
MNSQMRLKDERASVAQAPRTPNKHLAYYLSLLYSIELTASEDGWLVEIPLLEGCKARDKDLADAFAMLDQAKRTWLTKALELGLPVPEPEP